MRHLGTQAPLVASTFTALVLACGAGETSEFGDGNANGNGGGTVTPGLLGEEEGNGPVTGSGLTHASACATGTAAAQRGLSNLVFQFDRSGSMGKIDEPNSNISVCKNVLKTFFGDPKSTGFSASLSLFPNISGKNVLCGVGDYTNPVATMQGLPSAALATAASNVTSGGGTPTLVALKGAHAYAQTVSAAKSGEKVAIVLVTDGEPKDCPDSVTAGDVATYAGTIRTETPTYVIGIGKSLTNLNQIAQSGSGRNAFLVDTTNPASVQAQFTQALDAVKAINAACDLNMPSPPAGQTLDPNKVNVLVTLNGVESSPIYDEACKADGWHYDNSASPTRVVLCSSTCAKVQKDPAAKVDLLFGCGTAISIQ